MFLYHSPSSSAPACRNNELFQRVMDGAILYSSAHHLTFAAVIYINWMHMESRSDLLLFRCSLQYQFSDIALDDRGDQYMKLNLSVDKSVLSLATVPSTSRVRVLLRDIHELAADKWNTLISISWELRQAWQVGLQVLLYAIVPITRLSPHTRFTNS
jgi:hypothetical protein